MQEEMLYRYWEYYAATKKQLSWKGNTLKVISAGTLNEHQGPDYQGSRFEFNGVLFRGAVEMHIKLNDWYHHQHHYDPSYREVQLHVISEKPKKNEHVTHIMRSGRIPTFVLPVPEKFLNKHNPHTCRISQNPSNIIEALQQLALNRLRVKVHSFRKQLNTYSIHQLFYQGYLRALGYPHNKYIFEWLALKVTQELIYKYKNSSAQLLALYLGSAGFLESNFQDKFAEYLKSLFLQISKTLQFAPLLKNNWQLGAVRYVNHPHFRLAGWVALVSNFSTLNIFDFFHSLIQQRLPYNNLLSEIENHLAIKTEKYWQHHYALDKPVHKKQNSSYLGPARIKEIIVNLLIPLSLAQAHQNKNYGFISYLEDLYLNIPGSFSYQGIYRRKQWLKEYEKSWPMFNLGQSFIELEESYCLPLKCNICPLGRVKN